MAHADIDDGRRPGLTTDERAELVELRREKRVLEMEIEILKRAVGLLRQGERPPKMIYAFIVDRCADLPVEQCCRAMKVSKSAFYAWRHRRPTRPARMLADVELGELIVKVHDQSLRHLRLPAGDRRAASRARPPGEPQAGRPADARTRPAGRHPPAPGQGLHPHAGRRDPRSDDLVHRQFRPDGPDRLWVQDITQHRSGEGWVYLAVVIDAWSRRVVGWSIADHLRAELVVDALDMATLRRRPTGTTVHADHGTQYCSWVFGQRLRTAGLMGSMGTVGDALDNAVAESFFASLQCELLDRHTWPTRAGLAQAIFQWIEGFYNPTRRHSTLGYLSPVDYETSVGGMIPTPTRPSSGGHSNRRQVTDWWTKRQRGLPPAMRAAIAGRHHQILDARHYDSPTTTAGDKRSTARRRRQLAPGRRHRSVPPATPPHLGEEPSSTRGTPAHSNARTMSRGWPRRASGRTAFSDACRCHVDQGVLGSG